MLAKGPAQLRFLNENLPQNCPKKCYVTFTYLDHVGIYHALFCTPQHFFAHVPQLSLRG